MPIDPNEAPPGYKAVEEIKKIDCEGCVFNGPYCMYIACTSGSREDGCSVIFVKENNDAD